MSSQAKERNSTDGPPLPPYSPELNPVERVWLHLKARFLSHRLHCDYDAIAEAACRAWNRLTAEVERIRSLCSYLWLPRVGILDRRYYCSCASSLLGVTGSLERCSVDARSASDLDNPRGVSSTPTR